MDFKPDRWEMLEFGGEYWWTGNHITQVLSQATPIFEFQFPSCRVVFLFDSAASHHSCSNDALRVQLMNLIPGRGVPIMRHGWYIDRCGGAVRSA